MSPNYFMLVGALLWLFGELWGVKRNTKSNGIDTTSQWVWLLEAKVPVLRVLVGVFVLSLFGHFEWHTWLLP